MSSSSIDEQMHSYAGEAAERVYSHLECKARSPRGDDARRALRTRRALGETFCLCSPDRDTDVSPEAQAEELPKRGKRGRKHIMFLVCTSAQHCRRTGD